MTALRISSTLVFFLLACGAAAPLSKGFGDAAVIASFTDSVVIPTYRLMNVRLKAFKVAVDALHRDPSDANLAKTKAAWIAARVPWEYGEAFLYGPVESNGYDPALDSWPVNHTDLDAVLATRATFSEAYMASLQPTQKGFHTAEYLLWGVKSSKTASELTARELAYLAALVNEMVHIGDALELAWTTGTAGKAPYRDVLASAGAPGNTAYISVTAAALQIIEGMVSICDEVANGKIAEPYDRRDPNVVESQYSFNSIDDFQDNIRGVFNAYTASVPLAKSSGAASLSLYVASLDPSLDAKILRQLQAAIDAIGKIPAPFRTAITTASAYPTIEEAQLAVRDLHKSLNTDLKELIRK